MTLAAAALGGAQHGLDRARLTERVRQPEARRVLAGDGGGEVVELAGVRVGSRDVEVLGPPIADRELDARGDAVPRIADAQDPLRADGLELAALGQVERAVEVGQDVALVRERRDEAAVDARRRRPAAAR